MNEVRVIALLAVSMMFASPIRAQDKPQQGTSDWPTRPLHFIVPFPAGGSTDVGARVRIRAHVHILPPSWGTLYELTKLDDDEFAAAIIDGTRRGQRDIGSPAKTHPRRSYGLGRLKNAPPSTTIQL